MISVEEWENTWRKLQVTEKLSDEVEFSAPHNRLE